MSQGEMNQDQLDRIEKKFDRSLEAAFSNGTIYIEPCENCMTDEYRKGAEEAV